MRPDRMRPWGLLAMGLATVAAADSSTDSSIFAPVQQGGWMNLAAKDEDMPISKDALFGVESEPQAATPENSKGSTTLPGSKDDLFGLEQDSPDKGKSAQPVATQPPATPDASGALSTSDTEPGKAGDTLKAERQKTEERDALFGLEPPAKPRTQASFPVRGFFQVEAARTYANPDHWSKLLGRLELGTQGSLGGGTQWKLSGRLDYNAVYDLVDFYQDRVRHDQRAEFQLRETYFDFTGGGLDWRVGRQHIVWGEMVGLFFADVVSAKDLREFVLPDFQVLRIPQWAARAEYFKDDFHAEMVWIPFPSYDNLGKPYSIAGGQGAGADFYPYPISPAGVPLVQAEDKPENKLSNANLGLRVSQLTNGWDVSGFWYSSLDSQPTFFRDAINKQVFYPRHERIWQLGGTLAKDLGTFVLKGEAVYTHGRRYNTVDLADADGVVKQNTLDWAVGFDFNPSGETRINTQLYQRYFFSHDNGIVPDQAENGFTFLISHDFPSNWKAEVLLVHSLNRRDWMLRPKASWEFQPNWKLNFGLDVFGGPPTGLFGQYDAQDRVYTEIRHDF